MTARAHTAIGNAIFDACGVRLESMPFTPSACCAGSTSSLPPEADVMAHPYATGVGTRSVPELGARLAERRYFADEGLLTAIHLALVLGRPLVLEGEPGVGKTEVAKVLSSVLGRELIRLQCYEGLSASQSLYEWDYPKQLLHIRVAEAEGREVGDLYTSAFCSAPDCSVPCERRGAVLLSANHARTAIQAACSVPERVKITMPELGTSEPLSRRSCDPSNARASCTMRSTACSNPVPSPAPARAMILRAQPPGPTSGDSRWRRYRALGQNLEATGIAEHRLGPGGRHAREGGGGVARCADAIDRFSCSRSART